MANQEHLAILKKGVEAWNEWRTANPEVVPDLIRANLRQANLRQANLRQANLRQADLTGADLTGADLGKADLIFASLIRADLRKANLSEANLGFTNLSVSNLTEADLRKANLIFADLNWAILGSTNLSEAVMAFSVLTGLDLGEAQGLESVTHQAPSSIGLDTFMRSKGAIPDIFLRGTGVPDGILTRAREIAGQETEFYSCFISYSTKNEDLAKRLHADLQAAGVRCWFAPEDLKIGSKLRPAFDQAIRIHDKLLLLLSEHSVRSDWVEKEVETAFERERTENHSVLFPVRLDDAVMAVPSGWAADIRRTRNIGDFRQWKEHEAYKKAFERLLRDLKASPSPPPPS